MRRNIRELILYLLLGLTLLLQGCKVKEYIEVPVEVEKIKTEYVHQIDSIYLHDSIATYIMQKGDTIFVDRYKYKVKEIYKVDTIHKTDSIPKIIKVKQIQTVEVNRVYTWQKVLMWTGGVGILLLLGFLINKFKIWKLLF